MMLVNFFTSPSFLSLSLFSLVSLFSAQPLLSLLYFSLSFSLQALVSLVSLSPFVVLFCFFGPHLTYLSPIFYLGFWFRKKLDFCVKTRVFVSSQKQQTSTQRRENKGEESNKEGMGETKPNEKRRPKVVGFGGGAKPPPPPPCRTEKENEPLPNNSFLSLFLSHASPSKNILDHPCNAMC